MTRQTAVSAPAQEPDLDAMIKAIAGWSLADLMKFNSLLEEKMLAKRIALQRPPTSPKKASS